MHTCSHMSRWCYVSVLMPLSFFVKFHVTEDDHSNCTVLIGTHFCICWPLQLPVPSTESRAPGMMKFSVLRTVWNPQAPVLKKKKS